MFKHIQKAVRFCRTFSQSDHLTFHSLHKYFIIKSNFFSLQFEAGPFVITVISAWNLFPKLQVITSSPLRRKKKRALQGTLGSPHLIIIQWWKFWAWSVWVWLTVGHGWFLCWVWCSYASPGSLCAWTHWNFLEATFKDRTYCSHSSCFIAFTSGLEAQCSRINVTAQRCCSTCKNSSLLYFVSELMSNHKKKKKRPCWTFKKKKWLPLMS